MLQIRIADPHFRKPEVWVSSGIITLVNMLIVVFRLCVQDIVLLSQTYDLSGDTLYVFSLNYKILVIRCLKGYGALEIAIDGDLQNLKSIEPNGWQTAVEIFSKKPYLLQARKPYSSDYRYNLKYQKNINRYISEAKQLLGHSFLEAFKEAKQIYGERRSHDADFEIAKKSGWVKWAQGTDTNYTLGNE